MDQPSCPRLDLPWLLNDENRRETRGVRHERNLVLSAGIQSENYPPRISLYFKLITSLCLHGRAQIMYDVNIRSNDLCTRPIFGGDKGHS